MNTPLSNTTLDPQGKHILDSLAGATEFNQWLFSQINKHLSDPVLEIGSGIGNISVIALNEFSSVSLSDYNSEYCAILRSNFEDSSSLKSVLNVNLLDPDFQIKHFAHKEKFSSLFILNVLEHIQDEDTALKNCSYMLKQGGTIAILVPAYNWLYSPIDKVLGHERRYTRKGLSKIVRANNFFIEKSWNFNVVGMIGWLIVCKLFRAKSISAGKINVLEKILPLAKILDKIFFKKIGLSVICIAKKNKC